MNVEDKGGAQDCAVVDAMLYAIGTHPDGTFSLTVFEDGQACGCTLTAAMLRQLADFLIQTLQSSSGS